MIVSTANTNAMELTLTTKDSASQAAASTAMATTRSRLVGRRSNSELSPVTMVSMPL